MSDIHTRIQEFEQKSAYWLMRANRMVEKYGRSKSDPRYLKAMQLASEWLMKANELKERGE